jgi:Domain of unknown function (DUF6398)
MPQRHLQPRAHERELIEELGNLVHGIAAPFVCGGSVQPEAPVTLRFKDGTEVAISRLEQNANERAALEPLLAQCAQAPYGKGRRTLYDRRVRDALQLRAEGGAFSVLHFDPVTSGVLEEVQQRLCPNDPNPLIAELYSVNVYRSGGHFRPHKDTPRGDDMLGSLVVCLPSRFTGGALIVRHHGAQKVFDWSSDISSQREPTRVHWAAFFGDVDHSISEVWFGLRVTLTYILRRGRNAARAPLPLGTATERLRQKLEEALASPHFLPEGGVLGVPCFHMYSQSPVFQKGLASLTDAAARKLKGRDCEVAIAALEAGLSVTLQPYLVETCADDVWRLKRFPSKADRQQLGDQVTPWDLEDVLPISVHPERIEDLGITWVVPPPTFNSLTSPPPHPGAGADAEEPALELFHSCEYSATGYFGNEGSETEFYLYAVLQVAIPPVGKGPRKVAGPGRKRGTPLMERSRSRTGSVSRSAKVTEIAAITDQVCTEQLDAEYAELCRKLITALARKRPSPLEQGQPRTWAGAVLYAVGWVNFLTDPSQRPHMTTEQLSKACGVGKSTLAAKFKVIRDTLRLRPMDPRYTRRELLAENPLARMVKIDGVIVDARSLPEDLQNELKRQGIIPDLPRRPGA